MSFAPLQQHRTDHSFTADTFKLHLPSRTGKTKGSFCVWNTFLSVHPPKKQKKTKSKLQKAQEQAQEVRLKDEDVEDTEAALGKS